jgi:hypothetical protein
MRWCFHSILRGNAAHVAFAAYDRLDLCDARGFVAQSHTPVRSLCILRNRRRRRLAASYLSVFIRTNQFNADPITAESLSGWVVALTARTTHQFTKSQVIRISSTTPAASRLPNRTRSRLTAVQNWSGW